MSRDLIVKAFGDAVRAYQTVNDNFDQAVADHLGMNRTDARCVDLIDQAGGMTAGEVARAVANPDDRRRVRVEATEKLWGVSEPLIGPMVDESMAILNDYSDEELE